MEPTLLIRADAGPDIGTGHVMRCLALAQGWQDAGGRCVFATGHELPGTVERRLTSEGFRIERIEGEPGSARDANLMRELASRLNAEYTVLDGYRFGADYQRTLKDAGQKLLVIDDYGRTGAYCADLLLDQNCGTTEDLYVNRESGTQLLLGTEYTLLRREFQPWREWKRQHPEKGYSLLVTMGGADPDNFTVKIIEALKHLEIEGMDVTVLIGAANPHGAALDLAVRGTGSIRLLRNVANVPSLMARAHAAIICGGGTLWELLFMGAAVLSYSRDAFQAKALSQLADRGSVIWLGDVKQFDEARLLEQVTHVLTHRTCRERMSNIAGTVVDGLGVQRVLGAMGVHISGLNKAVRMVSISAGDKDEFMRLAAQYFSELNPAFTPHADWREHYFENIQDSPDHFLRWIMDGTERAGFILFGVERHRFLPRETGVIYDLYVAPEYRKKGIAHRCAGQAIAELRSLGPRKIQLETVEGNGNARALWSSLGFEKVADRFVLQEGGR